MQLVDQRDPMYIKYHDEEWGVPVHDDKLLFEFPYTRRCSSWFKLAYCFKEKREITGKLTMTLKLKKWLYMEKIR